MRLYLVIFSLLPLLLSLSVSADQAFSFFKAKKNLNQKVYNNSGLTF